MNLSLRLVAGAWLALGSALPVAAQTEAQTQTQGQAQTRVQTQLQTDTLTQSQTPAPSCAPDRAIFLTDAGAVSFSVEIADDVPERAQGLMNRTDMPRGQGMLFIYDAPRPVAFWMKNTLIPLDMIFMDETGTIRRIHEGAVPLDETPIPGAAADDPRPDRLMILEIAGGEAARLGLQPGQAMAHPRLDQDLAAAPCG